ncbi:MAG: hypothetical protein AAFV96_17300, partial [Pseudomonadota bacterium]
NEHADRPVCDARRLSRQSWRGQSIVALWSNAYIGERCSILAATHTTMPGFPRRASFFCPEEFCILGSVFARGATVLWPWMRT